MSVPTNHPSALCLKAVKFRDECFLMGNTTHLIVSVGSKLDIFLVRGCDHFKVHSLTASSCNQLNFYL